MLIEKCIKTRLPLVALLLLPFTSSFSFVPKSSSRFVISERQRVFPQAHVRTSQSQALEMKLNKKQRKVQESLLRNQIIEEPTTEMPENLKRQVQARRPLLGHVIPEKSKRMGGTTGPTLRAQGKARADGLNNPSNLKILGGIARGRKLISPDVYLRPMMGKVKEAVYSTFTSFGLYSDRLATRHLDIFSGSGSVGLESLSRGASHCTFVDLARNCCETCQKNIDWCEFGEDPQMTRVVNTDALTALRDPVSVGIPAGFTYNLVTLCPPYEEIVYADLLEAVANSPCVTEDTVILIEYPVELGCLPHVITREDGGALIGVRNRKYGRTVIAMYVVNPTGRLDSSAESRPEEFVSLQ